MLTTLRAAFSLALLVGFYLYVLGIVVGLLTLSGWLISRGEVNQFTIALAVISLVLAGSVLVETWRAARAKPEIPGLPLPEHRAPELWATVRQLADAVGTRPPDEIRLVPEVNAAVTEHSRLLGLRGGRRYLFVGLPLVQALSVSQLRAVLAHELGHYSHQHARMAEPVHRGRMAIHHTLAQLARRIGVALLVLVPYGYLYFLMSAAVSRRQELEADRAAARLAGRASMISALRELPGLVAAWEFYLQTYVNPGLRMTTLAPANVLSYFPTLLAARSGELAAIRAQSPPAQRSRWDSHPPPANRIAMLEREPDSPVPADLRPGAVMIPYLEAVAVELEASAFDFGDRPRVPFDQYLAATAQAVHQQAADRFYRGLARIAGLAFPHLATALELLAAGRHRDFAAVLAPAAGPDVAYTVVRDALASAIAVAVSSRGLGQWQGSWAGAPMLLGPGGVTIDCRAWAERALRGEAARVRDELADWGVDLTVSAVRATVTADGAELVAALVNVRINRKRQDLVILDTGLVILPPVPLLRSGVAGNRMAELLQQGVPAVTAVPDSQFIPYEMIIAASVRGRLWIRFRFRLHTGERLTIKPANDSGDLGGGWVALRQAVGRFASAGNPVVTPVPAAGGLRLDGPR